MTQLLGQEQDSIAALVLYALAKQETVRPSGFGVGLGTVPEGSNDPLPDEELVAWYGASLGGSLLPGTSKVSCTRTMCCEALFV